MNLMPIGIAGNRVCLCVDCGIGFETKTNWPRKRCEACFVEHRREDNRQRARASYVPVKPSLKDYECQSCNLTYKSFHKRKFCKVCAADKERERWRIKADRIKAENAAAGRARIIRTPEERAKVERQQRIAQYAKERELAKRQQKAAHVMAYRAWIKERKKEQAEIRRQERAALPRKPWNEPGLTAAEKWRIRYKLDPEFNIRQRVRLFDRKAKTGRYGEAMRAALKNNRTSPTIERSLGYTIADLKRHLERQFTKGMDWDKFCAASIHIDHIIPLASFDLADPEQMRAAWAITNLRPMWATDNIKKSSKRQLLL